MWYNVVKEVKVMADRSIRVSEEIYKILSDLKKRTGLPIKRIIYNSVVEYLLNERTNNDTKSLNSRSNKRK